MTKQALNFTAPPEWYRVFFTGDTTEQVTNMCISEDGNHLFITTFSTSSTLHNIYKLVAFLSKRFYDFILWKTHYFGYCHEQSNCLLDAKSLFYQWLHNIHKSRSENPDVLVMTLGGDNFVPHIYASTNATSDTLLDFESILKKEPDYQVANPIYTALVEMNNSDIVFGNGERYICNRKLSSVNPLWELPMMA